MSTDKSVYGLVTPEENLIIQLAGYVRGGRSIQMTTLVGVLQLLERQTTEIINLNQQLSAKIISEQNIINAFGISGEGAHSKLVIEYVHGLVAENAALKSFGNKLDEMHNDLNGTGTGIQGGVEVACQQVALEAAMEEFDAIETPNTDAFTAELRAQGADEFGSVFGKLCAELKSGSAAWKAAKGVAMRSASFAANLRAGRKG